MIESDTIKLLRECDAGIKMGIESIMRCLNMWMTADCMMY